ncbi:hypothetical protein PR002_g22334 [Phytophthora rubi]|uniref:Uncharacterized protein n=1 Tax=Phytophthora rubi TaxID=129364 RepID=A0A6A3ITZ6_9STRA|nr:hypothetical protein PR002_g22334 [Phytophthora rubi]
MDNSSTRQAGLLTSADAVKEGPVKRTSGEPEKQEAVDLEDGGRGEGGAREQDVGRAVKEGPVSRTSGEPEKQEGMDLEDDVEQEDAVKEGPVGRTWRSK